MRLPKRRYLQRNPAFLLKMMLAAEKGNALE